MKRALLLVGLLVALSCPLQAAANYPSQTVTYGQTTFGTMAGSVTWNYTTPAGSNIVLFVGCGTNSTTTITGVTHNGVSMTRSGTAVTQGAYYATLFQLVGPASGTNSIVATDSATDNIQCAAWSFSGATTPTGYVSAAPFFANVSQSITCTSNDLAADFLIVTSGANPTTSNMSQTVVVNPTPQNFGMGGSYQSGTNPTMTWSTSATEGAWMGVCVKAASVGSSSSPSLLLMVNP